MPAVANRTELARLLGVSEPTLDRLIQRGMPVAHKGGNGRAYRFDVAACTAWYRGALEQEEAERQARDKQFAQIASALGQGDGAGEGIPAGLTGKARLDALNAALLEARLAKIRGETVALEDVKADYEAVFQLLRMRLLAVDTMLVRTAGLSPAQAGAVRCEMQALLKALALQIAEPDWRPAQAQAELG